MILAEMKPFNDLLFFSLPTTHTMTRIKKFYSKKSCLFFSARLYTPSIPEIIWVQNVRAIVVCGFLMKSNLSGNGLDWLCYLAGNF